MDRKRTMSRHVLIHYLIKAGVLSFILSSMVSAGSLDAPAAPTASGSAMYTLKDICARLDNGSAGDSNTRSTFTEPTATPAATDCSLNDVMSKAPTLDDSAGAVKVDVASGKKFWGLSNGEWGVQTGSANISAYPALVPQTGQTTPSETGTDGDLTKGVAIPSPRFTDNNSDGTVTDNLTGLIWLKNANCTDNTVGSVTFSSDNKLSWTEALAFSAALASGKCGLTDSSTANNWRLPNIKELQSLINFNYASPALSNTQGSDKWTTNAPFSGVQTNLYWSSTSYAGGSNNLAWYLNLEFGLVNAVSKTNYLSVWPVRGGQ